MTKRSYRAKTGAHGGEIRIMFASHPAGLALRAPITTTAEDIRIYLVIYLFIYFSFFILDKN